MALLVVGLAGCFWPVPGQNPDRTAHNPSETSLGPANVAGLAQRWNWTSPASGPVHGVVTSSAGVHVVTEGDCRLTTLRAGTGQESWNMAFGYFEGLGFDACSTTALSDPFVAQDKVWVGRQVFYIKQPPGPMTFEQSDTLGFSLDGSDVEEWPGALIDNLRGATAHGISGHLTSTTPPPPFPPIPQYSFVTTVSVGELGASWQTVDIPPEPADVTTPGRTLGTSELYDAGVGVLTTVPGDTTTAQGNGVRSYDLDGVASDCGPASSRHDCPLWVTALDGTDAWRPVISSDGAVLYVGTDAGTVYAIDAATGAVLWSAPVGSAVTAPVALDGDTVFVPTASGNLVALAADGCGASTCPPVWSGPAGSKIHHQPAIANGVVYTASIDGSLHAFATAGCATATCAASWTTSTGRSLSATPTINNGWLYAPYGAFGSPAPQSGLLAYTLP